MREQLQTLLSRHVGHSIDDWWHQRVRHCGRSQTTLVRENSTTDLQSTKCGTSDVPYIRFKPKGMRLSGISWRFHELTTQRDSII